jgi:hypothetical protein
MEKVSKNGEARRKQLATLYRYQGGLCCHCREPMSLGFEHIHDKYGQPTWDHATIEHTMPAGQKGLNLFCNYLAACYDCNNRRGDSHPSDELIEYHMEIHQAIIDAGEYPTTAQRPSVLQFTRLDEQPGYAEFYRDPEEARSPFEILLLKVG